MKKKLEQQIFMQRTVMHIMERHLGKWQPVAELKRNYDLFIKNLKRIDDSLGHISIDLDPIRHELAASRTKLIEQLFPATSVLAVYAIDRGDRKLQKMAKVKFTELEKMDPRELEKYTRRILKTIRGLIEKEAGEGKKQAASHIKDYGLGEKHLEDMQQSLDHYMAKEEQLEQTRLMRKKSRKKLAGSVRDNNALLKKKIDRLMQLFRETESAFYKEYVKARLAVGEGAGEEVADTEPAGKPVKPSGAQPAKPSGAQVVKPSDGQPVAAEKSTAEAKKSTAGQKKKETSGKP